MTKEKQTKRLIVISGLSGSGKTIALHALEDFGYYCIDNMPASLLRALLDDLTQSGKTTSHHIAVGVDARNRHEDLQALPKLLTEIRSAGIQTDLIFLQAEEAVLLKRYSETRRKHPLANAALELRSAIQQERELLGPIINAADLIIDSSRTSIYELADAIKVRVNRRQKKELSILLQSFGFKHGIPADADFVFDLRCLPNPYWDPTLRALTGLDIEVVNFLEAQKNFNTMYEDIMVFLKRWIPEYLISNRSYLTIALGCTGGQHRSVCMTEKLAAELKNLNELVHTRHNELAHHASDNSDKN